MNAHKLFAAAGLLLPGGVIAMLAQQFAPEPARTPITWIGLVLMVAIPIGYLIISKRREGGKLVPGTGMNQRQWNAEVQRRRDLISQFVRRFRGVGGVQMDENHLYSLTNTAGTDQVWAALKNALEVGGVHTQNAAAVQAVRKAAEYKATNSPPE